MSGEIKEGDRILYLALDGGIIEGKVKEVVKSLVSTIVSVRQGMEIAVRNQPVELKSSEIYICITRKITSQAGLIDVDVWIRAGDLTVLFNFNDVKREE